MAYRSQVSFILARNLVTNKATKSSLTPSLFSLTACREAAAAPAPHPRPPQFINCAAVSVAIDEEEVNYRVWEKVTGRYSGWRPGWVGLATFLPPSLYVDFFFVTVCPLLLESWMPPPFHFIAVLYWFINLIGCHGYFGIDSMREALTVA